MGKIRAGFLKYFPGEMISPGPPHRTVSARRCRKFRQCRADTADKSNRKKIFQLLLFTEVTEPKQNYRQGVVYSV